MTTDNATARRMINNEVSEEEEAKERARFARYRDMLWEHIEGCHERYKEDMEDGAGQGAFGESQLFSLLSARYFGGSDA